MQLLRSSLLWASRSPRVERLVRRSAAMRPLIDRFMPGENLDAAMAAVRRLRGGGVPAVLSYLGENVHDASAADASLCEYFQMVTTFATEAPGAQVSIKLSQLGWDLDRGVARDRLDQLADHAARLGATVYIDMEGSGYAASTIDVFTELLPAHANLGLCLQAYLHRTPEDLERLLPLTPRLRLVKGAYHEAPSVALQARHDIDARYLQLADRLLSAAARGVRPAFGTHDLALIERISESARTHGVATDAWEIQMLYGIQTDGLRQLAARGFQTRVFICYGSAWYPWFMRRLAERPANLALALRNLL